MHGLKHGCLKRKNYTKTQKHNFYERLYSLEEAKNALISAMSLNFKGQKWLLLFFSTMKQKFVSSFSS
jgi:hypothetical protein